MSLERGLEVVVPRGFDRAVVPALVLDKAGWVARVERRFGEERAARDADPPDRLPHTILLRALDEEWAVEYVPTASTRVTVTERGPGFLRVSGSVADLAACRMGLCRWLGRKARQSLIPWLGAVGREQGLHHAEVVIRAQRTRWGSCSRRGAMSLNQTLHSCRHGWCATFSCMSCVILFATTIRLHSGPNCAGGSRCAGSCGGRLGRRGGTCRPGRGRRRGERRHRGSARRPRAE